MDHVTSEDLMPGQGCAHDDARECAECWSARLRAVAMAEGRLCESVPTPEPLRGFLEWICGTWDAEADWLTLQSVADRQFLVCVFELPRSPMLREAAASEQAQWLLVLRRALERAAEQPSAFSAQAVYTALVTAFVAVARHRPQGLIGGLLARDEPPRVLP